MTTVMGKNQNPRRLLKVVKAVKTLRKTALKYSWIEKE